MKDVMEFITSLLPIYVIKHDDAEKEKAWTFEMIRQLRQFPSETLKKAAEKIKASRTDRRFPLPSECRKICLDVQDWLAREERNKSLPLDAHPIHGVRNLDWTTERFRLADDLMMSAMGKEAARDGWIGTLHSFARKNSRLPKGPEIDACKRESKENDAAYAKCVKGGWGQAKHLESMGAEMLRRRNELADRVLGRR